MRAWARDHAAYVFTNPDLLHLSMLPGHARWARFLAGLRFVVVDEAHRYRGVFGSQVGLVLRRMRRFGGTEPFLELIDRVRARAPLAGVRSNVIVGFPGETEEDFAATLDVVERARFASAFTFQYSKRPGTPAAELPDQLPKDVVQERYMRLIELQERISFEENVATIGSVVELLVATGEGRKDAATERMSGRARDNRLVHVRVPEDPADRPRPGDLADVVVSYAAPHHLTADEGLLTLRRTRGGDAWQARRDRAGAPVAAGSVGLGMPGLGVPAALPPAPACATA